MEPTEPSKVSSEPVTRESPHEGSTAPIAPTSVPVVEKPSTHTTNDRKDEDEEEEEEEEEDKIIEKSHNSRFHKRNKRFPKQVEGVDSAFVAIEPKSGKEVIWNECILSDKRSEKENKYFPIIKKLKRNSHPFLARFLDAWIGKLDDGTRKLVFITERLDECTLKQFLCNSPKNKQIAVWTPAEFPPNASSSAELCEQMLARLDSTSLQRNFIDACLDPNPVARSRIKRLINHPAVTEVPILKLLSAKVIVGSMRSVTNEEGTIGTEQTALLKEYLSHFEDETVIVEVNFPHDNIVKSRLWKDFRSNFTLTSKFLDDVRNGFYPLFGCRWAAYHEEEEPDVDSVTAVSTAVGGSHVGSSAGTNGAGTTGGAGNSSSRDIASGTAGASGRGGEMSVGSNQIHSSSGTSAVPSVCVSRKHSVASKPNDTGSQTIAGAPLMEDTDSGIGEVHQSQFIPGRSASVTDAVSGHLPMHLNRGRQSDSGMSQPPFPGTMSRGLSKDHDSMTTATHGTCGSGGAVAITSVGASGPVDSPSANTAGQDQPLSKTTGSHSPSPGNQFFTQNPTSTLGPTTVIRATRSTIDSRAVDGEIPQPNRRDSRICPPNRLTSETQFITSSTNLRRTSIFRSLPDSLNRIGRDFIEPLIKDSFLDRRLFTSSTVAIGSALTKPSTVTLPPGSTRSTSGIDQAQPQSKSSADASSQAFASVAAAGRGHEDGESFKSTTTTGGQARMDEIKAVHDGDENEHELGGGRGEDDGEDEEEDEEEDDEEDDDEDEDDDDEKHKGENADRYEPQLIHVTAPQSTPGHPALFTHCQYVYIGAGRWQVYVQMWFIEERLKREAHVQVFDYEWHDCERVADLFEASRCLNSIDRQRLVRLLALARHNCALIDGELHMPELLDVHPSHFDVFELLHKLAMIRFHQQVAVDRRLQREPDSAVGAPVGGTCPPTLPESAPLQDQPSASSNTASGLDTGKAASSVPVEKDPMIGVPAEGGQDLPDVRHPNVVATDGLSACADHVVQLQEQQRGQMQPQVPQVQAATSPPQPAVISTGTDPTKELPIAVATASIRRPEQVGSSNTLMLDVGALAPRNAYCALCDTHDYLHRVDLPAYLISPCYHCREALAREAKISPEVLLDLHLQHKIPWPAFLQARFNLPTDSHSMEELIAYDCRWRSRQPCRCLVATSGPLLPPCVEFPWLSPPPPTNSTVMWNGSANAAAGATAVTESDKDVVHVPTDGSLTTPQSPGAHPGGEQRQRAQESKGGSPLQTHTVSHVSESTRGLLPCSSRHPRGAPTTCCHGIQFPRLVGSTPQSTGCVTLEPTPAQTVVSSAATTGLPPVFTTAPVVTSSSTPATPLSNGTVP